MKQYAICMIIMMIGADIVAGEYVSGSGMILNDLKKSFAVNKNDNSDYLGSDDFNKEPYEPSMRIKNYEGELRRINIYENNLDAANKGLHFLMEDFMISTNKLLNRIGDASTDSYSDELYQKKIAVCINEQRLIMETLYNDRNELAGALLGARSDKFDNTVECKYNFSEMTLDLTVTQKVPDRVSMVTMADNESLNMQLKNDFYYIRDYYERYFEKIYGVPFRMQSDMNYYRFLTKKKVPYFIITGRLPVDVSYSGMSRFTLRSWQFFIKIKRENIDRAFTDQMETIDKEIETYKKIRKNWEQLQKDCEMVKSKMVNNDNVNVKLKPYFTEKIADMKMVLDDKNKYKEYKKKSFKMITSEIMNYDGFRGIGILTGGILSIGTCVGLSYYACYAYGNQNQFSKDIISSSVPLSVIIAVISGVASFPLTIVGIFLSVRAIVMYKYELKLYGWTPPKVAYTSNGFSITMHVPLQDMSKRGK